MPADITRDTSRHAIARNYTRIVRQQGRVDIDADVNESLTALHERGRLEAQHFAGTCGAPKADPGFNIVPQAASFRIGAGQFYAHGLHLRNASATTYENQPFEWGPAAISTILDPNQIGLVYLRVFERVVTALEDRRIREEALGGPDTAARWQTVWQVDVMKLPSSLTRAKVLAHLKACQSLPITAWNASTGQALVTAGQAPPPAGDPNCLLPPDAEYTSTDNHLYRIEIHRGGSSAQATFKWSRNNGADAARLVEDGNNDLRLPDADALTFDGAWVEVLGDETDLQRVPGHLCELRYQPDGTISLTPAPDLTKFTNPCVRRWDQRGMPAAIQTGIPLNAGTPVTLEHGIQVTFSSGRYRTGDYWQVPARAATGTIDWPGVDLPTGVPPSVGPFGGQRYHCPLALVQRPAGAGPLQLLDDLRVRFPPLTCIHATDVRYDDSKTLLGADDVQEAIEALNEKNHGLCTYRAAPGPNWEKVFDRIAPGASAQVCLGVGEYPLTNAAIIANKGRIVIRGAGHGVRIVAQGERALEFQKCASVHVDNLSVRSGKSKLYRKRRTGINGALHFSDCGPVDVSRVRAHCEGYVPESTACVVVQGPVAASKRPGHGDVRVQHCAFLVGTFQVGVLVAHGGRVRVTDNDFRVVPMPRKTMWDMLVSNRKYRGQMGDLMITNARPEAEPNPPLPRMLSETMWSALDLSVGDIVPVNALVPDKLLSAWRAYPGVVKLTGINTPRRLALHLRNVAAEAILNEGTVKHGGVTFTQFKPFVTELRRELCPAMFDAVIVAGRRARVVQITGNEIASAFRGITAACSVPPVGGRRPQRAYIDHAQISSNVIRYVPLPMNVERHGILASSVRGGVIVEKNAITMDPSGRPGGSHSPFIEGAGDGIRIRGLGGPFGKVRANYMEDKPVGIRIVPHAGEKANPQGFKAWLVSDNYAAKADSVVRAPVWIDERDNFS